MGYRKKYVTMISDDELMERIINQTSKDIQLIMR